MEKLDQTISRYLLGEMTDAEQAALEARYFSDHQLFDQMVETENDLADRYARGQLPAETRRLFEQHYLIHPERRERAKFARALAAKLDRVEAAGSSIRRQSWWGRLLVSLQEPKLAWAFSLALLLLIAGLVWFALQTRRLNQELGSDQSARALQERHERDLQQQLADERKRGDEVANELDRVRAGTARENPTPSNAGTLATLILNISGVRGAETGPPATLAIAPGSEQARIQLNLRDNDYQSYSVVIQSAEGKQLFKRGGLQSQNKTRASLSVVVPTRKFSSGDYILTLSGVTQSGDIEDLNKSLFRVEKK